MRIRCPSCSSTYDVPDTLLERPRTVRCAKCAHDWLATPIEESAPPEVLTASEPTADVQPRAAEPESAVIAPPEVKVTPPVATLVAHEPPPEAEAVIGDTPLSAIERLSVAGDLSPRIRRRDRMLTTAWAASFAILAGLGVAGYTERNALMRQWPASKRVYATLGLVPADGRAVDRPAGEGKGSGLGASGQRAAETTPPR